MSGGGDLQLRAALLAALRGDATLASLVNHVSDGEPLKASPPWLMLGEATTTRWGARGVDGLNMRQPIQLALRGDDTAPVLAILARIDAVLTGLDDTQGAWRITGMRLERSRIARGRTDWRASADYAVRAVRLI